MRLDLPKLKNCRAGLSTLCFAWLLVLTCLGGPRALAQDVPAGNEPSAIDAVVEMDAEVNTWLARATAALRSGNPDHALPLLLHILRSDPAVMASTNGTTFLPARKLAVQLIRALPERTLAAYRLQADVPARMVPERSLPPADMAGLEAFYRACLPGAAAAETGLRLAGLYLDQERFRDARRVLQDVIEEGSAGRAQRSELLARLVVACARVGDTAGAEWAWAELQKEGVSKRWSSLGAELRPATPAAPASNVWAMAYGGPSRDAVPSGPCPDLAGSDGWALHWGLTLEPGVIRGAPGAADGTNPPPFSLSRGFAVACVTEKNRRPATAVIFAGNRAWVNGYDEVDVVDLDSGRPVRRVARVSDSAPDSARTVGIRFGFGGGSRDTTGGAESWVFGNRLNRAASLIGERVYCIEDNHRAFLDKNARERQVQVGNTWVMRPQPCGNALAAYESGSGRLLWRIGRDVPPEPKAEGPEASVVWDIPPVSGIAVDGNLDDWRGRGREFRLRFSANAAGGTLSDAVVGVGWNDLGVVIRASVIDEDIQEHDAVPEIWMGDSIEIFLADRRGGLNCVQVAAGTGADPRYRRTRFHIYDWRKTLPTNPPPEVAVAGAPAPRGYTFEARMPWSNLGFQPRSGDEAALQIYVNNAASNRPTATARFYPEGSTHADTTHMYRIRLADAPAGGPLSGVRAARNRPANRWRANAIRFASAPVPCAGLLLAPVEDDSGLGMAGLDAGTGAMIWRTRLAYGIPLAAPRAAPLAVTVDGAQAYLCAGNGSVSCLDGCDGSVLWTALYEPFAASSVTNSAGPGVQPEAMWEESLALVVGKAVVALPEDSREILAFDRRNGTPLWARRKPEGVDYVVGRTGTALIVAGGRAAACVDLEDGRERWRTPLEGSTGRGALCGREALIPSDRTILRLRVEDGAALGSIRAQTMDDLPLGNLYINGDRLLVAGLERLHALVDTRPVYARLNERLSREPTGEAFAERGRLNAGLDRRAEAVADLREAWKRQRGSAGEESARGPLLTALWRAAEQDPGAAKAWCAEAREIAASEVERAEATWRLARYHERTGDTNGALALYAALVTAPDAIIPPALGDDTWEASARRLAARRIPALLAGDEDKGRALLEEPAAQALARLGPSAACTALVEVATLFAGTAAGQAAAFKAAHLAAGKGDLGTAEAILQRALTLSPPSARIAVVEELVRLYDRMKWPQGAAQLRDEWPRLGAGEGVPEFLGSAAAGPRRGAPAGPLPPWRLRWRKTLGAGTGMQVVPAGLFYWSGGKQAGCLALDTGLPRWQRDGALQVSYGRMGSDDSHLMPATLGDRSVCVDMWSGAIATNILFQSGPGSGSGTPAVSRIGLATIHVPAPGGVLASVDALTGRTAWKRRELDSLLGGGTLTYPVWSSADGVVLTSYQPDRSSLSATLDPWTGDLASRRSYGPGAAVPWGARRPGRAWNKGGDDAATERSAPVIENKRLTVKNLRTGAAIWISPADIDLVKHQIMAGGTVLAQTAEDELLLLDDEDGRILFRSRGVKFPFDYASNVGEAVIAFHGEGGGTNEVLVLDPAGTTIAFHGRLSQQMQPLMTLGPAMTNQLLVNTYVNNKVKDRYVFQRWLHVVDARGENSSGWRLPRSEDIGDTARVFQYNPLFAGDLILVFDQSSGDVLAYEHDPGDGGGKKP